MAQQKSINIDDLEKRFKKADKDKSGRLSKEEVKAVCQQGDFQITDSQFNEVFKFFETEEGHQEIALDGFRMGLQKLQACLEGIKELFHMFDTDKSGCLDKDELKKVLEGCDHKYTDSEINEIFKKADPNGDNKISETEFINAML